MARTLEEARLRFRAKLVEAGAGEFVDDYLSVARSALILRPEPAPFERDPSLYFRKLGPANEDDIPPGTTKIGGWPDMPRSWRWPVPTAAFVLQIDLAQLPTDAPDLDLPREGLLSLFVDPDDVRTASLIWTPREAGRLQRTAPPDEARLYLPRRVGSSIALTLDLDRADAPIHDECQDAVFDALAVADGDDFVQLGGDPHVLNPMQEECEERGDDPGEMSEDDARWRLVFQVGNIDECEMAWEVGSLYVWMRAGDLKERRFDKAVAILHAW